MKKHIWLMCLLSSLWLCGVANAQSFDLYPGYVSGQGSINVEVATPTSGNPYNWGGYLYVTIYDTTGNVHVSAEFDTTSYSESVNNSSVYQGLSIYANAYDGYSTFEVLGLPEGTYQVNVNWSGYGVLYLNNIYMAAY
jgi:hypothetical protein